LYVLNSSIAFSNRFVPNVVFSVLAWKQNEEQPIMTTTSRINISKSQPS
jgi:hypothetical protein